MHLEPALLVPDLVCIIVCSVATVTDLRSGLIPNWLTLPAIGLGLCLNTLLPALGHGIGAGLTIGLVSSVAGCLLLLLAFGLLGLIHFVGMGDVKLMAAVGALLRWPTALPALAYVALCGGVIALVYALARGRIAPVLRNLFSIGRRVIGKDRGQGELVLHRIPYALAILLGASWAAAARYLPALAIP